MRTFLPALLFAGASFAQDAERALIVVDPDNAESRYVANYYRAARDVPGVNVLLLDPGASNYGAWATVQGPGYLGELENRGITDTIDFVLLPPGDDFIVSASGYVNDGCSPVNRFALASCFTLAHQSDAILAGLSVSDSNHYRKNTFGSFGFESRNAYRFGDVSTAAAAERYVIGAMIGWTGQNGNTLQEVLDTIDRSVAADGTLPTGTFYFMETTDAARSTPRDGLYTLTANEIISKGGAAQHLMANLPTGNHDALGVMTGLANPAITDPSFSLVPGAFADHLTSYAGTFWNNSQTKMSEWITKGASGTAGTVEEPCNYSGKFPSAHMHAHYHRGLTLGEAWFRSHAFKPFQCLLLGDPLTRPWGKRPTVSLTPPAAPVAGTIMLTPSATAVGGSNSITLMTLFVDGVAVEEIPSGDFTLDSTTLSDGWHELRVRAVDNKAWRNQGRWIGDLEVDNHPGDVNLSVDVTSGDLGTAFSFTSVASGLPIDEVVLLQYEQVIATFSGGTAMVYGQNLGAGPVRVQAEARFSGGERARSAPIDLSIDYSGGASGNTLPTAFDFTVQVREDAAFVLSLPGTFDDDPATVTTAVLSGPAQSSLLGGHGSWRAYEPGPLAVGSDTVTYQVTGAAGTSNVGTITIEYVDVDGCSPIQRYCTSLPNSTGNPAVIDFSGSNSLIANDLTLSVSDAPTNQFGLFFMGDVSAQLPFGEGLLCAMGNVRRFPVTQVDGSGLASQTVDVNTTPGGPIQLGETVLFQFWYRDPSGGPDGFNTSDALEATFCP